MLCVREGYNVIHIKIYQDITKAKLVFANEVSIGGVGGELDESGAKSTVGWEQVAILRGSCTTGQFPGGRVQFPPGPLQDIL